METKVKKEFDAVDFMRTQRNSLSEKLSKMTKSEILAYFKNKRKLGKVKPSAK